WVILILAGFYTLIEWKGWRRWVFPLVVVGMNSIAAYVMSWTMSVFFGNALNRHLGKVVAAMAGWNVQPVLHGFAVMLIFWFILFGMYRKKIFLRIWGRGPLFVKKDLLRPGLDIRAFPPNVRDEQTDRL